MKNIFYLGGLPRSGSTLLCNILAQNKNLYVSKCGTGCSEIIHGIKKSWPELLEHKAEGINHEQMRNVLISALNSYHYTDSNYIVDKSRNWLSMFETLEYIQGKKPKIIAPVRNMTQVIASFEKLYRKGMGQASAFNFDQSVYDVSQTVAGRCSLWCESDNIIGIAYNRIKDIISRGHKGDVLFLEFDLLTQNPSRAMEMVYNYLELPHYQHDFNYVEQYTQEDDLNVHGIPDLHTIRNKVEPVLDDSRKILGEELYHKYSNLEIWR